MPLPIEIEVKSCLNRWASSQIIFDVYPSLTNIEEQGKVMITWLQNNETIAMRVCDKLVSWKLGSIGDIEHWILGALTIMAEVDSLSAGVSDSVNCYRLNTFDTIQCSEMTIWYGNVTKNEVRKVYLKVGMIDGAISIYFRVFNAE